MIQWYLHVLRTHTKSTTVPSAYPHPRAPVSLVNLSRSARTASALVICMSTLPYTGSLSQLYVLLCIRTA